MNKKQQKIISDSKDQLLKDIQNVLDNHGLKNITFSIKFRLDDCPGGYWKTKIVRNPKTGKDETQYIRICP